MPDDKVSRETDGDPKTKYEDTDEHPRLGFRVDDKGRDEDPNKSMEGIDNVNRGWT